MFLTSRVPFPLEKGDKLRAYHQMKTMSKRHDVYLISLGEEPLTEAAKEELTTFCSEVWVYHSSFLSRVFNIIVSWWSGHPFQVGYFFNAGADLFVKRKIAKIAPDHIFVQLVRMAEYVKGINHLPKSLDYMDSFSTGMLRRKEKEQSWKKVFFDWEYKRLANYERAVFKHFNHHFIISEQDRDSMDLPEKDQILIIPNGVDDAFFQANAQEATHELLFTGNMSYAPNVAAVCTIVNDILPLVWEKLPHCKLMIAGANPSPEVKALEGKNVTVTGWLDDIRTAYHSGMICLAPLDIGTGLQNKLLEAMSMELPCITSSLTNNALGATHGKEIIITDTPEESAAAVVDLLQHEAKRVQIGKAGKEFVKATYNWEAISLQLEKEMGL